MAWSLKGFTKAAAEVDVKALAFHVDNGDFESWAEHSLRDQKLATHFKKLKESDLKGETLRKAIVDFANKRYVTLSKQVQDATQLF